MTAFAVDGTLARRVVAITESLAASALTLLVTAPAWGFALMGGWQATHPSLWFGALSLVTVGPAAVALLVVVRGVLARRERSRAPMRTYVGGLALGFKAWRFWLLSLSLALVIGYQVALSEGGLSLLPGALLAVVLAAAVTAVASALAARGRYSKGVVGAALRSAVRVPAVLPVWVITAVGLPLVALIPLVGATLAFLAPVAWAVSTVVVNASFGFDREVSLQGVSA